MRRPSSPLVLALFAILLSVACSLAPTAAAQGAAAQGESTHIELILDASGSMFNKLDDGRYRIVAAKDVLADLIASLPDDEHLNVGLRVYGSSMRAIEPGACEDTVLKVPLQRFDRQLLLDTVRSTQALGATPIALSLEQAALDFPADGRKLIVLITDGEESCRSDLREVAERLRSAGLDIDLRIIGFDLDEAALRSLEGLGTLENARSAADLLSALTRAVEVEQPVAPTTYPVTVTLTRGGEPASDGPVVEFIGSVDDEAHAFTPSGAGQPAGTFTGALPAGSYTARVSDAFSAQPLLVAGLAVVAHGANEFTFELAPAAEVTLTVAEGEHVAGSTTTVTFDGAPTGPGWLALAPTGAGDDLWLVYFDVEGPAGETVITLPDAAGDYEVRYHLDLPDGGSMVLGRTTVAVVAAEAALEAPADVGAGSRFEVGWEGPDNADDYITIVLAGSPEGSWDEFAYTADGNPVELTAPDRAGEYELRYLTGGTNTILARRVITVTGTDTSLTAPAEVLAGSHFQVGWTGPGNQDDYITIVPVGSPEGAWHSFSEVRTGNPVELWAPDDAGEYELRYVTGNASLTLARTPITVTPASASLQVPDTVAAGEPVSVTWEGPNHANDYLTIVPVGTPEGQWLDYVYLAAGNPVELPAPREPGQYEVRYVTGQSGKTLVSVPLTVR